MSHETPPPSTSVEPDRATDFAKAVNKKQIVAGPDVRNAARRHLRDLKLGPERGLVWDPAAARFAIGFFEDVLCLNGGEFEGMPFVLAPWQAFIVGSLFGWKRANGYRRFRTAFIETAKGSGKSPLAAGIGLLGLVADNEARAEVYAAATKRDQAMILFRDAVAMVKQSPSLTSRVVMSGRDEKVWNLFYPSTNSFFKSISADDGQSGPRPHVALLDEIHEHRNANVVNMVRAGTKSRRQALIVMITNSGSDKNSVCWDHHELGSRICKGEVENDAFFAFICSLDKRDDPFKDESCWAKVNPSLDFILEGQTDGIPGRQYLREQVDDARGMPSKESVVRRLNFCEWTQATSPWISWEIWSQASQRVPMSMLRNRACVGGLDLASTTDLTAFVLLFYPTYEDPHWRLLPYFWIPDHELEERERRDKVPYSVWIKTRDLETTPGRAISKLHVLRRLQTICGYFDVRKIAYDSWRIEDLVQLMSEHDITLPTMVGFRQGTKSMGPAVDEFERRLLGMESPPAEVVDTGSEGGQLVGDVPQQTIETLRHDGNPVMTWCASNAVTTSDAANNRKADKSKATGRIDGIVAAIMATGISGSVSAGGNSKSIYEEGVGI
ncbi:phage terminase large subunit-like protein [Pseudomonas sp. JUb42]|uniref:terminase large subunit n=1 Tax=Pseudomonas sp. JUb42 TaxID=2940611 RepID=UPI00216934E0|nr:terminase TerL endonuclease subunit [Pseudomonas sp. JUb42]MCS3467406.1 phage terminase large subunit-like protein [Pseudomonas sp. JUb42]